MSPVQRKVLDFVAAYITAHRIAPTMDEIKEHLGLASKGGAHSHVEALIAQGHLVRTCAGSRKLALAGTVDLSNVPTAALRAELQRREAAHG